MRLNRHDTKTNVQTGNAKVDPCAYVLPRCWLNHWSVSLVSDVTSAFYATYHASSEEKNMAEAVTPKKLKLLGKMCSIWKIWDNPMKNVKLKQKLVSKLQEIVATKNLDPNNIFASINLFVVLKSVNKYFDLSPARSPLVSPCGLMQENYPVIPRIITQWFFFGLPLL